MEIIILISIITIYVLMAIADVINDSLGFCKKCDGEGEVKTVERIEGIDRKVYPLIECDMCYGNGVA